MRQALLLSIRLYLRWFFESFSSTGRMVVPLGLNRLLVLLILFPLFLMFQALHWLGFFMDEIFFRGYRKTIVKNPLFVTGVPRSGTTFLHRALAGDDGQFTTFRTWEAILAPSVTERKIIHAISWIDKKIGRPGHRLLEAMVRKLTGNLSDVHEIGIKDPEEDYLAMLPAAGCFIAALIFPASPTLWLLARFQDMPKEDRVILINFYKSIIKKHLYVHGNSRRLLSKNAAFASWIPDLRMAFPDARFIFCLREPKAVLSSQLSSIRGGIRFFATEPAADTFSLEFQTVLAHAFRILRDEMKSFLPDHLAIIDQGQLQNETAEILTATVKKLCLDLTDPMKTAISEAGEASRRYVSPHKHQPLPAKAGPSEFTACVEPLYLEMIEHSIRP